MKKARESYWENGSDYVNLSFCKKHILKEYFSFIFWKKMWFSDFIIQFYSDTKQYVFYLYFYISFVFLL